MVLQKLEQRIAEWRSYMQKQTTADVVDVEELEVHLRGQIDTLREAGLDEDEAFIIAVKRTGERSPASSESVREYTGRLWKQFVSPTSDDTNRWGGHKEVIVVVVLAILSAIAIKIPELFGLRLAEHDSSASFYIRNFSLFVLPFLAGYFVWKRGLELRVIMTLAITFIAAALVVNLLPFVPEGHTEILTAIHLPIALWFAVGYSYTGQNWQSQHHRMNFIRFSGEWFIYYTLIACGGGVLVMFVVFTFGAIGMDAEQMVTSWILPCGAVGAVLVASWLVEAKQSIIEAMAPVLTRIFTPLFVVLLVSFLVTVLVTRSSINIEREVLIGFDLLLIVVLGLLLYSISARNPQASPGLFDLLQLVLVICALLVDILALIAMVERISEFGSSANKVAALGLNLILLVNLGWSAILLLRFLTHRSPFSHLAHWQTTYIPVYAAWAGIVAVIFPVLFNYR